MKAPHFLDLPYEEQPTEDTQEKPQANNKPPERIATKRYKQYYEKHKQVVIDKRKEQRQKQQALYKKIEEKIKEIPAQEMTTGQLNFKYKDKPAAETTYNITITITL